MSRFPIEKFQNSLRKTQFSAKKLRYSDFNIACTVQEMMHFNIESAETRSVCRKSKFDLATSNVPCVPAGRRRRAPPRRCPAGRPRQGQAAVRGACMLGARGWPGGVHGAAFTVQLSSEHWKVCSRLNRSQCLQPIIIKYSCCSQQFLAFYHNYS